MGHVTVVGGCRAKAPLTGILASTLSVGATVKLIENGAAVEYLVVNQGIPENSSLYDTSCDGTWLLRKDVHSDRQWNTRYNTYENSLINTWLNKDFFDSLGEIDKSAVKYVKIPYGVGNNTSTVNSGANGLRVKAFLLGFYECGWTTADSSIFLVDGAKLTYFEAGKGASANNKRIAYLNGTADDWFTRCPNLGNAVQLCMVSQNGGIDNFNAQYSRGIRPAMIITGNAIFDETTMLLKGVA